MIAISITTDSSSYSGSNSLIVDYVINVNGIEEASGQFDAYIDTQFNITV